MEKDPNEVVALQLKMKRSQRTELNAYARTKKKETSQYIRGLVTKDSGITFISRKRT